MSEVKLRGLPAGTPLVPDPVEYTEPNGYLDTPHCGVSVFWEEVRLEDRTAWPVPGHVGYYCTLPPNHGDTPHACHVNEQGRVVTVLVWGGE